MIENDKMIDLDGYEVHVYYERYAWSVWLQGTGVIGYSPYNREEAIDRAREYLRRNSMSK